MGTITELEKKEKPLGYRAGDAQAMRVLYTKADLKVYRSYLMCLLANEKIRDNVGNVVIEHNCKDRYYKQILVGAGLLDGNPELGLLDVLPDVGHSPEPLPIQDDIDLEGPVGEEPFEMPPGIFEGALPPANADDDEVVEPPPTDDMDEVAKPPSAAPRNPSELNHRWGAFQCTLKKRISRNKEERFSWQVDCPFH